MAELDLTPHDDPEQDTPERHKVAQRSTLVSVIVNLVLTTVQVVVGVLAHSQALIADGIHSLSDLIADFVVLVANKHSHKEADDDHHYGHHRYETAASLVLGALLLTVGVGMLWGAVGKLSDPEVIPQVKPVALWVALIALASKELLFRYMLAAAERVRSSMLVANAWHARSDAASSLVVALGIVGNLMGFPLLDPVAALIVGLMVTKMGWEFGWDALNDLMDRSASQDQIEEIIVLLKETPGVHGVHDVRTRKMGDMIMVDAHLEVDGSLTVKHGHDIAVAARERVMQQLPVLDVMVHLDPV
ncbi:cation diffusion facilitator family transporter [Aquabacterium sp.]|uniref:cation diffusion facilitator family transporter n=1 Tax=Aquabacterium sp. TaxID=1872578 RepID=UPI002E3235DD|nr:cation diffusion facilitator family transporter [Aquabacterium sp.]HEX5312528.1 cation diffusion facilitator family transporter [Aquabacterium sp.]